MSGWRQRMNLVHSFLWVWMPKQSAFLWCAYGKIEALCSFLQGENVRNFQSLQNFWGGSRAQPYLNSRRGHSGFMRCCVERLKNHLYHSGNFDDPYLEDADIQFRAWTIWCTYHFDNQSYINGISINWYPKVPVVFYFLKTWDFMGMSDSCSVSQKKIELPIKNRKILLIFV